MFIGDYYESLNTQILQVLISQKQSNTQSPLLSILSEI